MTGENRENRAEGQEEGGERARQTVEGMRRDTESTAPEANGLVSSGKRAMGKVLGATGGALARISLWAFDVTKILLYGTVYVVKETAKSAFQELVSSPIKKKLGIKEKKEDKG